MPIPSPTVTLVSTSTRPHAPLTKSKSSHARTFNQRTLSEIGSFGGMFDGAFPGLKQPVLVASADGVGTKLKIAFATGVHNTVGRDLVNHCVNDILVQGARPLFFLDYIATGKLSPEVVASIVEGVTNGCRENGCVLLGGETAEMPGFYQDGEYDIAGFIVGVVDRERRLSTARQLRPEMFCWRCLLPDCTRMVTRLPANSSLKLPVTNRTHSFPNWE